ncbi:hypothetical protein ACWFOP_25525 [Bacillus mycoides]
MYNYNPYYQNGINEQQRVSRLVKSSSDDEYRPGAIGRHFVFNGSRDFKVICQTDAVNHASLVVSSICEVSWNGSDWVPFGGDANMSISNVIPKDCGDIEVWGHIYWGSALNYQISLIWF